MPTSESLIARAARLTGTQSSAWRMIGAAAVHESVKPSANCYFLGPAIIRDGVFHGGCFFGGVFYGGYFCGGFFRGGDFYGGFFEGGYFFGGEFRFGVFMDGHFYGGVFRDGYFFGGGFYAGEFYGGDIRGGVWNRSPLYIQGSGDPLSESDSGCISLGFDRRPAEWWFENTEEYTRELGYSDEQVTEYKQLLAVMIWRMQQSQEQRKEESDGKQTNRNQLP